MTQPQFTGGAVDLSALTQEPQASFTEVTERDIEQLAFERSMQVPVVLMVGSARSQESETLKEELRLLVDAHPNLLLTYLDADAHPQLAQAMGVRALPTVVALAGGRPVTSFEGSQPREQLQQWVEALVAQVAPQLPGASAADAADAPSPGLAAAEAALAAGDLDAAEVAFNDALAADAADEDAKRGLALLPVLRRVQAHKPDAAEDPLALADAHAAAGDAEAAFNTLLPLVKTSPEAKARLLELFGVFGNSDPRVIAGRTALASALF